MAFALPRERRQDITDALRSDKTFTCHKTIDYGAWAEAEEFVPDHKNQHCAGALIVLIKGKELWANFLYRLAVMAKLFDPDILNLNAPVFNSLDEWVEAADENRQGATPETM